MNKVICDVCGTDYPETEARCPICDCVRADGGQTSAGNTEEDGGYTYVKGGRFSKANVRKRLKAGQKDPDLVPPAQVPSQMPSLMPEEEPEADDDEEGFDEEELEGVSNKGLIIIVVLLLLAIIAVASYIVIRFMQPAEEREYSRSTTSAQDVDPGSQDGPGEDDKTCTALVVPEEPVSLTKQGQTAGIKRMIQKEPADSTDPYSFISNDANVVTVDQNGIVTAVGPGETTITVSCGSAQASIKIVCDFETEDPADDPVDDPSDDPSDDPVDDPGDDPGQDPDVTLELKLRYSDVTLDAVFPTLQLYNGQIDPSEITWTSSKESVATVENGLVTPVALGSTKITAEYKGQTATCMIHVSQKALDKLGIGQEPEDPEDPEDPVQPLAYSLKLNGSDPKWNIDGRANTADVSLVLGGSNAQSSCRLTVVDAEGNAVDVSWSISDASVVEYDAESGKFVSKGAGVATLTASYDGVEFEVKIRVS